MQHILHMCRSDEWAQALKKGRYCGSSQDIADGFIHFSTPQQIRTSASRHRAGQDNLVLLSVDVSLLPDGLLKWEESRNGALFPHLYGDLPVSAVVRADPLLLGEGSQHIFPDHMIFEDGN